VDSISWDAIATATSATAAVGGAAGGLRPAGGPPSGAHPALSIESAAMLAVALLSSETSPQFRELGIHLDARGWLALPTGDTVFLPAYLAAQDAAIQAVRRCAESDSVRDVVTAASRAAWVIRFFSIFNLCLAIVQLFSGGFTGVFGLLAAGGYHGARVGRSPGLFMYLVYCAYAVGMAGWGAADAAAGAAAAAERGSAASTSASTGSTLSTLIIGFTAASALAGGAATLRLLWLIRALRARGWRIDSHRTAGGDYVVVRQRRTTTAAEAAAAGGGAGAGGGGVPAGGGGSAAWTAAAGPRLPTAWAPAPVAGTGGGGGDRPAIADLAAGSAGGADGVAVDRQWRADPRVAPAPP
jgi:hypothetical protein